MTLIYSKGSELLINTHFISPHLVGRLPEILPKIEREVDGLEMGAAVRVAEKLIRQWSDRNWSRGASTKPKVERGGFVVEIRYTKDGKVARRSWSCVGFASGEEAQDAVLALPELAEIDDIRSQATEDPQMPHDDGRRTYLVKKGEAHESE